MTNIIKATTASDKKLQWHQAFYANIQIEFENFSDKLIFENEHHLGTQPKRIDVLIIPIQLIITKNLTDEQNLWLHNLTNDIHNPTVVNTLICEYDKHQKDNRYKSVMDILVHANKEVFKEVSSVCKALEDLYWEVHGERIQREQKEALDKAVAEAVDEAVAKVEAKAEAEKNALLAKKDAYIKQLEAQLGIVTA